MVRLFFVASLALFWCASSFAQAGLPKQCLQSFNVKDKPLVFAAANTSCRTAEARRGELFTKINSLADTGEIDGAGLSKDLAALESKLEKEQNSKNWVGLTGAVTGNALATIGLATCLETSGAGCALAVVGKVLAIVGVIDSATSESDKSAFATSLRKEIEAIRKKNQDKKSPAKQLRERLISDFTQLCDQVQKQCL